MVEQIQQATGRFDFPDGLGQHGRWVEGAVRGELPDGFGGQLRQNTQQLQFEERIAVQQPPEVDFLLLVAAGVGKAASTLVVAWDRFEALGTVCRAKVRAGRRNQAFVCRTGRQCRGSPAAYPESD